MHRLPNGGMLLETLSRKRHGQALTSHVADWTTLAAARRSCSEAGAQVRPGASHRRADVETTRFHLHLTASGTMVQVETRSVPASTPCC